MPFTGTELERILKVCDSDEPDALYEDVDILVRRLVEEIQSLRDNLDAARDELEDAYQDGYQR